MEFSGRNTTGCRHSERSSGFVNKGFVNRSLHFNFDILRGQIHSIY